MSQSNADVIRGVYDAFGRADIPAILAVLDEGVDWSVPDNLPHGGDFQGRDAVGLFFQGIGENWEDLAVDIDAIVSSDERVVVLARMHGRLRATSEQTAYAAAHAWTLRDGTPVRFAEYVDAPLTLPAARTATT
jgi:ketosteroid isomerase-like protein